ncbi:AbiH family protein [Olleya sp. Bg11-27]|uniref:AbiH family protein n=1 Tax=Olleya sp. Bg11-27 TaxID=2058135 RepID=UPI000C30D910|nr:AbiH family protein [Olleya sp. Bg11-27]AUC74898.1 hypothetical protein CW732_04080 [Olleya sp. Bg11-27]
MNRLYIIGNGFDLAHGLPTSYNNFIDDFWTNLRENISDDGVKELLDFDESNTGFIDYGTICNYSDFVESIKSFTREYTSYLFDEDQQACITKGNSFKPVFKFKNSFLRK